ncbi:MAG: hypothetical protein ACLRVT_08805 [Oscillospiraceae bacterium]
MSRLQALRDALRPLGIYRLDEGSLVYAELAAYAAGLDLLEEGLDELEREAFVQTAQGEGISKREKIYCKPKTLLPLQERREMLLYRGAINNRNNTRADLERALVACGLRATVKENLDGATIYINCFDFLEDFQGQEEIRKAAGEFLPCHLEAAFDFRTLDWDKIDSLGKTFSEMDAAAMTWEEIDAYSPA